MENLACDFEVPMKKNIGIDDHSAMQYWALNHFASYFETQQIAWQALRKLPGNIAIVGDLQSNHWRQAVFYQGPQVTTISAPCISRSGAGKEQGSCRRRYRAAHSSWAREIFSTMGKGGAVLSHIFPFSSVQLVTSAGYRTVYHKCLDAKDHVPMARPRWIGIAMDVLSHDNFDVVTFIPTWLGSQMFHPRSFGCDWNLPEAVKQTVRVPYNVLQKYFDKKYA